MTNNDGEFAVLAEDTRRIWDTNARWWDDRIGDGNDFQTLLIEPATERLLGVRTGDTILDIACGAGRFARRMADLGARVLAFDQSEAFVARARERTPPTAQIEYHVASVDAVETLLAGFYRIDKAVCTMAIMDMAEVLPLFAMLSKRLAPEGIFVFSVTHPCFHSADVQRFAELTEETAGRHVTRTGVKVSAYLSPFARKTEGIVGQPEPQWFFHRPLSILFRHAFDAGFCVDGLEEPRLPPADGRPGVRWSNMTEIPPIMVVRMRRMEVRGFGI
jgi:2-polyprenyl-3-methyl-5-hydroxy-6-metoxy-1,4-benzoquinol methylase